MGIFSKAITPREMGIAFSVEQLLNCLVDFFDGLSYLTCSTDLESWAPSSS